MTYYIQFEGSNMFRIQTSNRSGNRHLGHYINSILKFGVQMKIYVLKVLLASGRFLVSRVSDTTTISSTEAYIGLCTVIEGTKT